MLPLTGDRYGRTAVVRQPITRTIRRALSCGTVVALLFISSFVLPTTSTLGPSLADATASICSSSSKACPTVSGLPYASTSEAKVTKFLIKLWSENSVSDSPLGHYELQRCENPDPVPHAVTCVLWSNATRKDLSAIKSAFASSRLFRNVTTTFPKT